MQKLILTLLLIGAALPAFAAAETWVTTDRLNRRTCPSTDCGIVGVLMFREKATVYEQKGGWARVTHYYDAFCEAGRSRYVESGNNACVESNGIVNGQFAEWVYVEHLSEARPADPGAAATGAYALVSGSDDYRLFKDVFAEKAAELIAGGQCSETDFIESGGWLKSFTTYRTTPVYFIYCGGTHVQNRLYLNVQTGEVFR